MVKGNFFTSISTNAVLVREYMLSNYLFIHYILTNKYINFLCKEGCDNIFLSPQSHYNNIKCYS